MSENNLSINPNDHIAEIATLVSDVGYLKLGQDRIEKSQEKFHDEVKATLKDLRDNYATRLDVIEGQIENASKVYVAKEEEDKKDCVVNTRLDAIEDKTKYVPLVTKIVFSMLGFILLGVLGAIMLLVIPNFYTK
jgi:hypothetical protein